MKIKFIIKMLVITILSIGTLQAQTVSVGSANRASINNSNQLTNLKALVNALSSKITTVKNDLATSDDELDKLKLCNDIDKIYNPDKAGADANGCVNVSSSLSGYYECPVKGVSGVGNCVGQIGVLTSCKYFTGTWYTASCTPL